MRYPSERRTLTVKGLFKIVFWAAVLASAAFLWIFSGGAPDTSKLASDPSYIDRIVREARQPPTPPTVDDLIFTANVLAIRRIKSAMKNPDSFKLEQASRMPDGALCLSYRATNSFNAVIPGSAVVTDTKTLTSDSGNAFVSLWKKHCANKTGTDITYARVAL